MRRLVAHDELARQLERCRGPGIPATLAPVRAAAALRNPMSKPALCATRTLPAANSRKAGSALSMRGASRTMESVMPVRTEMNAGMGSPG